MHTAPDDGPLTYTVPEAAALLGVSTQHLYRLTREGRAPFTPLHLGSAVRFTRSEVDRVLG